MTPIIAYVGVVFSFMGSLLWHLYHFDFLVVLKETLTFLSLSNLVQQYLELQYLTLQLIKTFL